MIIAERNKFYKLQLIWSRIRHRLVFLSFRNLISRVGIDIEPYYWVKEGSIEFIPPIIKGNQLEFSLKKLNLAETKEALLNSSGMSSHIEKLKDNFENGQSCIALVHEDKIAAYMFIETNNFVYKHKNIILKEDEAYLLNMYTFESYRGKNLAPYIRYKSYEILNKQGINNIYSITQYFNKSSKKFKDKLNARNLNLFLSIELFNIWHKHFLIKSYK